MLCVDAAEGISFIKAEGAGWAFRGWKGWSCTHQRLSAGLAAHILP